MLLRPLLQHTRINDRAAANRRNVGYLRLLTSVGKQQFASDSDGCRTARSTEASVRCYPQLSQAFAGVLGGSWWIACFEHLTGMPVIVRRHAYA